MTVLNREPVHAPELVAEAWLNTDRPLRLTDLRGKLVLLDFFTCAVLTLLGDGHAGAENGVRPRFREPGVLSAAGVAPLHSRHKQPRHPRARHQRPQRHYPEPGWPRAVHPRPASGARQRMIVDRLAT